MSPDVASGTELISEGTVLQARTNEGLPTAITITSSDHKGGAAGSVYFGTERDNSVAVKVANPRYEKQLALELGILRGYAGIEAVPRVLSSGEYAGMPFFVMEDLRGREKIGNQVSLKNYSSEEAVLLLRALAGFVSAINARNGYYFNGDRKPVDDLYLLPRGSEDWPGMKLLDFGGGNCMPKKEKSPTLELMDAREICILTAFGLLSSQELSEIGYSWVLHNQSALIIQRLCVAVAQKVDAGTISAQLGITMILGLRGEVNGFEISRMLSEDGMQAARRPDVADEVKKRIHEEVENRPLAAAYFADLIKTKPSRFVDEARFYEMMLAGYIRNLTSANRYFVEGWNDGAFIGSCLVAVRSIIPNSKVELGSLAPVREGIVSQSRQIPPELIARYDDLVNEISAMQSEYDAASAERVRLQRDADLERGGTLTPLDRRWFELRVQIAGKKKEQQTLSLDRPTNPSAEFLMVSILRSAGLVQFQFDSGSMKNVLVTNYDFNLIEDVGARERIEAYFAGIIEAYNNSKKK